MLQQCYPDDDALLHLVTRVGSLEEIELLVASGARVNAPGDLGYTPLHYAALKGRLDVAKRLLLLGANASLKNEFGETAATIAGLGKHTLLSDLLGKAVAARQTKQRIKQGKQRDKRKHKGRQT